MKEIEVSAILEQVASHDALAVTPDGICYSFNRHRRMWARMQSLVVSHFSYWNFCAYSMNIMAGRRIYRGIFTIKVADNG